MPELRRDPIIGRWVIVSTERGKRPATFPVTPDFYNKENCPFCEGKESFTPPEILAFSDNKREPNSKGWWLRVVPNKFPALAIEGSLNREGDGMYDKMNGVGAHEVIIETTEHSLSIPDLKQKQIEDIVWAYRARTLDLKQDIRLEYIAIFKNHGFHAGASLAHPHSQLIATPIIPKRVAEEISGSKEYFSYKERCVFCDMIRQEIESMKRVVAENDAFIAFCPYASRFPFETWILPKKHESKFEDIQSHGVSALARIMRDTFGKLKKALNDPPYNFILHNSPLKTPNLEHYHWHIEIIPKLTRTAGFEWGTGFYINPTPPEKAAEFLRSLE